MHTIGQGQQMLSNDDDDDDDDDGIMVMMMMAIGQDHKVLCNDVDHY